MLTTVQVRNDLKEIRYYYSMKELFDRSSKTVKPLAIVQKVERYNTTATTEGNKIWFESPYFRLYRP